MLEDTDDEEVEVAEGEVPPGDHLSRPRGVLCVLFQHLLAPNRRAKSFQFSIAKQPNSSCHIFVCSFCMYRVCVVIPRNPFK